MTRRSRLLLTIFSSLAGLLLVCVVTAILVLQTSWFQNYLREKIISITEDATGGKVEIGSFSFDWATLHVALRDFVIHGTEPAGSAPLLRVDSLDLQMKMFSGYMHLIDLKYLGITRPVANVMVFPNGKTNIPEPKTVQKSNSNSGLQTIVDLQVKRFVLSGGKLRFAQQSVPLDIQGQNLLVALSYDPRSPAYDGKLTLDPIYARSGQASPLTAHLSLPVRIEGDAITLSGARLYTDQSHIDISAKLNHLASPIVNAKASIHLSVPEIQSVLGLTPSNAKLAPAAADAEFNIKMDDQRIDVQTAWLKVGESTIEASGRLRDPAPQNSLNFKGRLIVDQLAKLANLSAQPSGTVNLRGTATVSGNSAYVVTGSIQAPDLRARNGSTQYGPLALSTQFTLDPHLLTLTGLRLIAFDGSITAKAELHEFRKLLVDAQLSGFELPRVASGLGSQQFGYDGTLSGKLHVDSDLKANGTSGYRAQALLNIAEGHQGVPVSGRIAAQYTGRSDTVAFENSYLSLPHSRLDLAGVLGRQINLTLVSRDLNDFSPVIKLASAKSTQPLPLQLQGGSANLNASVSGPIRSPQISGNIQITDFTAEQRRFDRLSADISASPIGAKIDNGLLQRKSLQARFDGGIGLQKWNASPNSPLTANASIKNADLADVMALAGQSPEQLTGSLNASANISGTMANPAGGANLLVEHGSAYGEPFDRANASVTFADQLIRLQPVDIVAGDAHLSASGTYTHPHESLDTGHLQLTVSTNDVSLAQFKTLQKQHPGLNGLINMNANAAADVVKAAGSPQVEIRTVEANISAKNLRDKSTGYGDLTASAHTSANTVAYVVDSNLAGSATSVRGSTRLSPDYPTTLNAQINSLQIEKALMLAGQNDMPIQGMLSAQAHLDGPIRNPAANLTLNLTKAVVYQEPIDEATGHFVYASDRLNVPAFHVTNPAGSIRLSGTLTHPPGDFNHGQLAIHLDSGDIQLNRIRTLQQSEPGLNGTLRLGTDLNARFDLPNKKLPLQLSKLDATVNARSVQMNGQDLGSIGLQAHEQGQEVAVNLDSNFARSSVQGRAQVQLAAGYPVDAQVNFSNVRYSSLQPLLTAVSTSGTRSNFDANVNGTVHVQGPLTQTDQLRGTLTLNQLALTSTMERSDQGPAQLTLLQNQGPLVVALDHQRIDIRSAHLSGRSTDISATGTADLARNKSLNLKLNATTDLALLQDFSRDIYSGGNVVAHVDVHGSLNEPRANGEIVLKDASLNIADSPNGISNANGVIALNGTTATIRSLTAESGGGKIALNGFAGLIGSSVRYSLRANATKVRTRYSGVSIVSTANLALNGTTARSLLNGTVTIDRVGLAQSADTGSILSSTAAPPETPSAPSGPLQAIRLDIHVVSSPALSVQTSVTQNLSANVDLNVRGTIVNPGVVGRVIVTQGNLVFFGNQYSVNRGVINFYNPLKIEPVLDIDLQTTVKGVDVDLGVTGSIDNMKLSYRSDPPLRFDEIVGLLATGKVPTSDPTIAAHEPAAPDQSLTQMGESAIVSQAVAAPLASRIQRVFGVNQLKIDPTFASGSSLPQARVTLQQQISPTIIFTYTTDLTQTTSQILRVEWAFTPRFSAVATRDENGIVSLDFFLKKQFR